MKKVLAICLTVLMAVSLSISVFAAPNGFVSSPTGNQAPKLEKFEPADDDCTAKLVIVPAAEKDTLPAVLKTIFEKAYQQITTATDLTKLSDALAKLAADKNIKTANLAVSDLFDIHVTGCDFHDGHADFDVTLSADTLKHFVALLHMNKDGVWEVVTDAKVTNNDTHLQFSVESFSPFAIVVDTTKGNVETPPTGDNGMVYICTAAVVVSALAIVVIAVKSKKQSV